MRQVEAFSRTPLIWPKLIGELESKPIPRANLAKIYTGVTSPDYS